MSTFSEGEVLASIATSTHATTLTYTCPAGKYAKLTFNKLSINTGSSIITMNGFVYSYGIDAGDAGVLNAISDIPLASGQSYTLTVTSGGSTSLEYVALEYLNP